MKNPILLIMAALLTVTIACSKHYDRPAPVTDPTPYINKYAGTYNGLYEASNNGVDSNGVYKIDTSYAYTLKIEDAGNHSITINHGPIFITNIPVDSTGYFFFQDYNHNITGQFTTDSLYLASSALNGYYDTIFFVGSWFVIQRLSFKGLKTL